MFNTARLHKLSRLRAVAEIPLATRRQLLRRSLPGECEALPHSLTLMLRDTDAALIGIVLRRLLDFSTTDTALISALADRLVALQSSEGGWRAQVLPEELELGADEAEVLATVTALAGLSRLLDEVYLDAPAEAARFAEVRHAVEAGFARLEDLRAGGSIGSNLARAWTLRLLSEAPEAQRFLPLDALRRALASELLSDAGDVADISEFAAGCMDHAAAHAHHAVASGNLVAPTAEQQDLVGFLIAQAAAA